MVGLNLDSPTELMVFFFNNACLQAMPVVAFPAKPIPEDSL